MPTLSDRIVFITGASAGIGAACARAFAREGARLLLCARRVERLHALAAELKAAHGTESRCFALDVRDRAAVARAIETLPEPWRAIDVLVNNAGLARGMGPLHQGDIEDWEEMLDTNVKGLLYVTRAVVPGMVERGRGHVINIGSIAGHQTYPNGAVYCASKFAVDAITKSLRQDLVATPIRVSTVDPGLAETEFSLVRYRGDVEKAKAPYKGIRPLSGEDIAESVLFAAMAPPHVNVAQIVLMPQGQAGVLSIHRKEER